MSSQLQDYFEEAVETVARLLYARNRTPREPGWMDLEPRMKEGAIRDARVVIDLWIKVEFAARDFMDAHEENENYPRLREALREIVDTAPGIDRWTIDRRLDDEQWTGKVAVEVVRASSVDVMVAALRAALAAADREKPDLPPGVRCRPGFAPPVPDEPKEKP